MGSLNGTYVNRERIDAVPLTNGDEVQIGKYRLVFFASHGVLTLRTRRSPSDRPSCRTAGRCRARHRRDRIGAS